MPAISDPGYELVKVCVEANISVVPIPGVTASITALCASGLPTNKFIFIGFLPTKIKLREEQLEKLSNLLETIVLYESPYRLLQTLEDLGKILGENRKIVLARELTKLHEEFWRGTVGEAVIHYQNNQPKGEFTLVIAGAEPELPVLSEDTIKQELQELFAQGISRSQASRQLSQKINLSRRKIYQIALKI